MGLAHVVMEAYKSRGMLSARCGPREPPHAIQLEFKHLRTRGEMV
jgi:hypothetical protein